MSPSPSPLDLRPLTSDERELIDFLLAEPFLGRDELRIQLATAQVVLAPPGPASTDEESNWQACWLAIDPSSPLVPMDAYGTRPVSITGNSLRISLEVDRRGRARRLTFFTFNTRYLSEPTNQDSWVRTIYEPRSLDPAPTDILRPMTPRERALIDFLLVDPFPGRDEVRQQMATTLVNVTESKEPCVIVFAVSPDAPQIPNHLGLGAPVHAQGHNGAVDVSIHYDRLGRIWLLGAVRIDDGELNDLPSPEELVREVF